VPLRSVASPVDAPDIVADSSASVTTITRAELTTSLLTMAVTVTWWVLSLLALPGASKFGALKKLKAPVVELMLNRAWSALMLIP